PPCSAVAKENYRPWARVSRAEGCNVIASPRSNIAHHRRSWPANILFTPSTTVTLWVFRWKAIWRPTRRRATPGVRSRRGRSAAWETSVRLVKHAPRHRRRTLSCCRLTIRHQAAAPPSTNALLLSSDDPAPSGPGTIVLSVALDRGGRDVTVA